MSNRFLIVVNLFVATLPTNKAEFFAEKVMNRIKSRNPEDFIVIIHPQREEATSFEVYALGDGEWTDGIWLRAELERERFPKLKPVDEACVDDQPIYDYVKLMLGAPTIRLPNWVDDQIEIAIEMGRRFDVNNLQQFVYEQLDIYDFDQPEDE